MITKRKLMDYFAGVATVLAALGGILLGFPPAYKVIADYRLALEDKKVQAAKAKLEDDQARAELAQKLGVPEQSTARMLSVFVDRLDKENIELKGRVDTLEVGRVARDEQINDLQEGQKKSDELQNKMAEEMETLRTESAKKDKVIEGQGKRIVKLEDKVKRLERHIKDNGLSLPDDWEHEGNGEKESSGGKDE